MKQLIFLLMLAYFLGSCTPEVSSYSFDTADSVKVDESKVVLTRFPSGLQQINDSVVGMVTGGQKISLYNIHSGKNILNFSADNVNFDSLVRATYQKRYAGKRIYTYDALTAGGLSDGNCQVLAFDHSDHSFSIYVNTLVDVNYDLDTAEMRKYEQDPQLKAIKEKTGDYNLTVQDYLEFLFITDEQFRIEKIIPLYQSEKLAGEKYGCYFQKGFVLEKGSILVPVVKEEQMRAKSLSEPGKDQSCYALAEFTAGDMEAVKMKLNYTEMDFSSFNINDFFSSFSEFSRSPQGLLYSNGREIVNTGNSEKVLAGKSLEANEWISSYSFIDKKILALSTYKVYKKQKPTDIEIAYSIDSINDFSFRLFDTQNSAWIAEKKVPYDESKFLATAHSMISIEKDKESYYFKITPYHAD